MVGLISSIKIKDEDENYHLEVEIKNVASNQNLHMSKIDNGTGCTISKLQNQNAITQNQLNIFTNGTPCTK